MCYVWVFAIQCLHLCHTDVDALRVFAVCHQQGWALAENLPQRRFPVHQHIAGAAAHKKFNTWYTMYVYMDDFLYVIVGGSQKETVVDVALPGCYAIAFLE